MGTLGWLSAPLPAAAVPPPAPLLRRRNAIPGRDVRWHAGRLPHRVALARAPVGGIKRGCLADGGGLKALPPCAAGCSTSRALQQGGRKRPQTRQRRERSSSQSAVLARRPDGDVSCRRSSASLVHRTTVLADGSVQVSRGLLLPKTPRTRKDTGVRVNSFAMFENFLKISTRVRWQGSSA